MTATFLYLVELITRFLIRKEAAAMIQFGQSPIIPPISHYTPPIPARNNSPLETPASRFRRNSSTRERGFSEAAPNRAVIFELKDDQRLKSTGAGPIAFGGEPRVLRVI